MEFDPTLAQTQRIGIDSLRPQTGANIICHMLFWRWPFVVVFGVALLLACGGQSVSTVAPASTTAPTENPTDVPITTVAPTAIGTPIPVQIVQETGAIRLQGLSELRAAPMSLLTITGTGFDSNAALKVRFFDEQGYAVDVPASKFDSTSVTVSVPPFIDLATGAFGLGLVEIQVLQTSTTEALQSNTIGGFQIEDLPFSTEPVGAITINYLEEIIRLFQDTKEHLTTLEEFSGGEDAYPELVASLDVLTASYIASMKEVESVIADPSKSVSFAQMEDDTLELNIETISISDRLIGSMVRQVLSGPEESTANNMGGHPTSSTLSELINFVTAQAQQETPVKGSLSLGGLDLSHAIERAESWGNLVGTMMGVTNLYNRSWSKFPKSPGLKKATGGALNTLSAIHFVGFTIVPATAILVEDLSTITAGTSKEAFNQAAPVVKRYLGTVGPGAVDALTGVPIIGLVDTAMGALIDVTESVLGLEIEDVSGKGTLITNINNSWVQRDVEYDSGRPDPNCSGLNLIQGIPCTGEPNPTPTPTLMPTPTPTPTLTLTTPIAPISVSDFSGTWIGQYSGLYTHGFSICGTTIPIEGSVEAVLTQTGTLVTGTVTLGGSNVQQISEDQNGNCSIVRRSDEVFPIAGTVSGDTLSDSPSTFSVTKVSENSADGRTKGEYLNATFSLSLLR